MVVVGVEPKLTTIQLFARQASNTSCRQLKDPNLCLQSFADSGQDVRWMSQFAGLRRPPPPPSPQPPSQGIRHQRNA